MRLEDQVVSLDLAQKLKTLGVKQESLFVWEFYDNSCHGIKYFPYAVFPYGVLNDTVELICAFTTAELTNILPFSFEKEDFSSPFCLEIRKYPFVWTVIYYDSDDQWFVDCKSQDKILANALAKMLIHLIENNLLENKNG